MLIRSSRFLPLKLRNTSFLSVLQFYSSKTSAVSGLLPRSPWYITSLFIRLPGICFVTRFEHKL